MRGGDLIRALALAVLVASPVAADDAPRRVVSMNLCTDLLAMLLAGPDQLHSVSFLSLDPGVSPMVEAAGAHVINRGGAEEIYLMAPDLVLAGAYAARDTVDMLARLGVRVETFQPANSFAEVRDRIRQMGALLHREAAAEAMVADFDARIAALRDDVGARPRAIVYYANGFTARDASLAGEILDLAGFDNAAGETGIDPGARLPLELLALTDPDIIITAQPYPGASRAEAILDHPIVRALRESSPRAALTDHDWVCGTPFLLRAAERLADARRALVAAAR